jgi:hypothetical protein
MRKTRFLSFAFCLAFAITDLDPVFAFPIAPQAFSTAGSPSATSTPDIDLVRFGGRGGGGYRGFAGHRGAGVRRGYAYRGGARVAHRGYGIRGGGMYRGYGVHRAAVGSIALAAVIMAASGMERGGVIGAAGGGPMASALAGGQAPSVTCGFADKTPCASVTLPPGQAAWFTPEADDVRPDWDSDEP